MISIIIYYATSALFFISITFRLLQWLYLWQQKEYRFDRIFAHLKWTKEGRGLYLGWGNILKTLLLISFVGTAFSETFFIVYPYVVFIFYLYFFVLIIISLFQRKIRLPLFTLKLSTILLLIILIEAILFVFHPIDIYFWMVLLDRLIPFFVVLFIVFFSIPSDFYKDFFINKAVKKIRSMPHILVIGITGSYGKGVAKEYLYTILSYKFNVAKSYGTHNTPIGIARVILNELNEKKEIFIVEMGAYKKGEVAEIAKMVNPRIAILTAISDQHLALFGGVENTIQTKYELVESIPRNGFTLFNGNSDLVKKVYNKTHKHKVLFEVLDKKNIHSKNGIYAKDISMGKFSLDFSVIMNGSNLGRFKAHLLGAHNIQGILPAIYVAKTLKMKNSEIRKAVEMIESVQHNMYPFVTATGALLIDDTSTENFSSIDEVLRYMKQYKGKKIIILQPLIELGKEGRSKHFELGKAIGSVCDYLITTNGNYEKELKRGLLDSKKVCQLKQMSPSNAAQFIQSFAEKNDIVLFEGREARIVLSLISHERVK